VARPFLSSPQTAGPQPRDVLRLARPSFGLILANRAVVLGAVKVSDLVDLTVQAERSGLFDAVWAGDSLLAKPRLESVTLLSALAGVTTKLRLGVGCMATFVHRHPVMLAHQWASLDVLSGGRTWLAVCLGGPSEANAAQAAEHDVMGIPSAQRVGRLEEGIVVLRKLFGGKNVSHQGRFYTFDGVTLEPRPVQQPCPIWIASNPTGLTWKGGASASAAVVERSFRRIAAMAREEGRDPAKLGSALYHNININEDRQTGLEETKAFLDTYYTAKFSREFVEQWTVAGGPKQCAEELRAYFAAGVGHMALRLASWDQQGQFKRLLTEVAPALQKEA